MLYIYTGDGKGKTTAALGTLIRAYGAGLSCAMVFFDKNSDFCSELTPLKELGIKSYIFGLDRVHDGYFRFGNTEADILEAKKALDRAWELINAQVDVLVLDELLNVLRTELAPPEEVLNLIDSFPKDRHLIITGRGLPEEIKSRADLVSEIQSLKHPFEAGIAAKKGIDY